MGTLQHSSSSRIRSSHWIPIDLVAQILVKLPVKSLLRFTCVSQSWNQLISTQEFSKDWMLSNLNFRNIHPDRLMFRAESTHKMRHCRLLNDASWLVLDPPPAKDSTRASPEIRKRSKKTVRLASGDGLVCIVFSNSKLALLNPITGKLKRLPKFLPENKASRCHFGLGFDQSSNQFKVVGFECDPLDDYNVMAKIYGLEEKGQWRRIKNHNGFRRSPDYGDDRSTVCANGKLHWIAEPTLHNNGHVLSRPWEIAYLDLETEEYGTLHKPDFVPRCEYANLVYSEGVLYVFCQYQSRGYADLWMIQPDYGKVDDTTWTKSARIPLGVDSDLGQKILVYVWRDGPQVLFSCRSKFVIFNNKDSSFTYPDIARMPHSEFVTYAETLSSL